MKVSQPLMVAHEFICPSTIQVESERRLRENIGVAAWNNLDELLPARHCFWTRLMNSDAGALQDFGVWMDSRIAAY